MTVFLVGAMLASPAPSSADESFTLRRWFGAEGGFEEISCFGIGSDCPGFSVSYQADAQVKTQPTGNVFEETGIWTARTGNRMFLAATPGGTPGVGFVSTQGSDGGPAPAGTIAFSFRVHMMPSQPVVIFRHDGSIPGQNLLMTLLPNARLAISAAGFSALSNPLTNEEWHAVTVSAGGGANAPIKIYIDDLPPVSGDLPLGGPDGNIQLGITSPTPTRFVIAIDDYAESSTVDAPIQGARVDYLMPLGNYGETQWQKVYASDLACEASAKNWQLVSEDQWIVVSSPGQGAHQCNLGGGAVISALPGRVDMYSSEGIPSRHQPSDEYDRDLSLRPQPWEPVLGVRLRIRGRTDTAGASTHLGFLEGGVVTRDKFMLPSDPAVGYLTMWGKNYPRRANGGTWDAFSLSSAVFQLENGSEPGTRWISGVRMDFVWIPEDIGAGERTCLLVISCLD